jgi:hypothetical protein
MATFAVLMRENDHAWDNLPEAEQKRILALYYAWADELRKNEQLVGGQPLGRGGRVLRAVDGEIVDGPFTETKEVLTGFFLIEAESLEEAARIARGCPALGHGETVELRPIGHV